MEILEETNDIINSEGKNDNTSDSEFEENEDSACQEV